MTNQELEAWIAQHLFKWEWMSSAGHAFLFPPGVLKTIAKSQDWTPGLEWTDKSGSARPAVKSYRIQDFHPQFERWAIPPCTSDRAAALEVLDHLLDRLALSVCRTARGYAIRSAAAHAEDRTLPLTISRYAFAAAQPEARN